VKLDSLPKLLGMMLHMDHARALLDNFVPRPVGPLWQ
jgi:hypothetical protein